MYLTNYVEELFILLFSAQKYRKEIFALIYPRLFVESAAYGNYLGENHKDVKILINSNEGSLNPVLMDYDKLGKLFRGEGIYRKYIKDLLKLFSVKSATQSDLSSLLLLEMFCNTQALLRCESSGFSSVEAQSLEGKCKKRPSLSDGNSKAFQAQFKALIQEQPQINESKEDQIRAFILGQVKDLSGHPYDMIKTYASGKEYFSQMLVWFFLAAIFGDQLATHFNELNAFGSATLFLESLEEVPYKTLPTFEGFGSEIIFNDETLLFLESHKKSYPEFLEKKKYSKHLKSIKSKISERNTQYLMSLSPTFSDDGTKCEDIQSLFDLIKETPKGFYEIISDFGVGKSYALQKLQEMFLENNQVAYYVPAHQLSHVALETQTEDKRSSIIRTYICQHYGLSLEALEATPYILLFDAFNELQISSSIVNFEVHNKMQKSIVQEIIEILTSNGVIISSRKNSVAHRFHKHCTTFKADTPALESLLLKLKDERPDLAAILMDLMANGPLKSYLNIPFYLSIIFKLNHLKTISFTQNQRSQFPKLNKLKDGDWIPQNVQELMDIALEYDHYLCVRSHPDLSPALSYQLALFFNKVLPFCAYKASQFNKTRNFDVHDLYEFYNHYMPQDQLNLSTINKFLDDTSGLSILSRNYENNNYEFGHENYTLFLCIKFYKAFLENRMPMGDFFPEITTLKTEAREQMYDYIGYLSEAAGDKNFSKFPRFQALENQSTNFDLKEIKSLLTLYTSSGIYLMNEWTRALMPLKGDTDPVPSDKIGALDLRLFKIRNLYAKSIQIYEHLKNHMTESSNPNWGGVHIFAGNLITKTRDSLSDAFNLFLEEDSDLRLSDEVVLGITPMLFSLMLSNLQLGHELTTLPYKRSKALGYHHIAKNFAILHTLIVTIKKRKPLLKSFELGPDFVDFLESAFVEVDLEVHLIKNGLISELSEPIFEKLFRRFLDKACENEEPNAFNLRAYIHQKKLYQEKANFLKTQERQGDSLAKKIFKDYLSAIKCEFENGGYARMQLAGLVIDQHVSQESLSELLNCITSDDVDQMVSTWLDYAIIDGSRYAHYYDAKRKLHHKKFDDAKSALESGLHYFEKFNYKDHPYEYLDSTSITLLKFEILVNLANQNPQVSSYHDQIKRVGDDLLNRLNRYKSTLDNIQNLNYIERADRWFPTEAQWITLHEKYEEIERLYQLRR